MKHLAEEMKAGLSREEYVQSRLAAYASANGARIVRRMLDSAVKVAHNAACVDCLREDVVDGQAQPKDERYLLRHTPSGWKIMSVQSRPLPPSALRSVRKRPPPHRRRLPQITVFGGTTAFFGITTIPSRMA
ncbi:MAG: hypothetical protein KatS3mg130_2014 [Candidatus Sumerlaea sp.]|nr:MAG: hypothetical protein KatS3mg130_2014 [Candidatus Sumerlaea sp.]